MTEYEIILTALFTGIGLESGKFIFDKIKGFLRKGINKGMKNG